MKSVKSKLTTKSKISKPVALKFTDQTFKYFDLAKKNKFKKEWFVKNKDMYEDHVKLPFSHLLNSIKSEMASDLKRILVDPKKITRPLRPSNKAEELGWVKDQTYATLWEPKTSLFEWNPAVYIQLGSKSDDNLIGVGLYMTSSRQIYKFREAAFKDYEQLDLITKNKKFKPRWGTSFGDQYKRFPKGYDLDHPSAKYIIHKQFYVGQHFTRMQVVSSKFIPQVVEDLKVAMPFLKWIRNAVGTYQRVSVQD